MTTYVFSWRILVRLVTAIGALAFVGACATPADPGRMALRTPPAMKSFPVEIHHAMCLRSVTGGKETNPLWVSNVSNDDFRTALTTTMQQAGLLASVDACKFPIDVNMLGLSQPSGGFTMRVTSHVNYKVFDTTGQPVLLETISAPYTATFSDASAGIVRLKLANEGSIRSSITQFLDKLRAVELP